MFPVEFAKSASAELLEALDSEVVTSVRYNPFKLTTRPSAGGDLPFGEPVPWNRYGVYLAQRPVFTLDPAMHAGAYYVQEASSQFVEHIYRQAINSDNPISEEELPAGVRLLDLCAAPGGKTTLYSTLVGPEGLVVANEPIRTRANVLADNVRRWGIGNVVVTCNDAADFSAYKHWFDVVAVDAPCSGEGMFRRSRESRTEWSPANVELCAARQKRILADAWDALRPGGVLIYSTCTFNRRENEENVEWLSQNFAVEPVTIEVPDDWGIECGEVEGIRTFRFLPHKTKGEGFFASAMRKADGRLKRETPRARREPLVELNRPESKPLAEWVNGGVEAMKFARAGENYYGYYRPMYQFISALAGGLNVIYSGVCLGQLFGGKLRPDHALALFCDLTHDEKSVANGRAAVTPLTREEALDYLRKRDPQEIEKLAEGLNLLTHNELSVGWTKRIGHRANTLLGNSFRIVNL